METIQQECDDRPSTPEPSSTSSQKHPAHPQDQLGAPGAANNKVNKRRRRLGIVTPIACTACRKKRAKCDGRDPCGLCKAKNESECVYEKHERKSKETLRLEIGQLQKQQRQSDAVFSALARPEFWDEIRGRLCAGQSVGDISEWLEGLGTPSSSVLPSSESVTDATPSSDMRSQCNILVAVPNDSQIVALGTTPQQHEPNRHGPSAISTHEQAHSIGNGLHSEIVYWDTDEQMRCQVRDWLNEQPLTHDESDYLGSDQPLIPFDSPAMEVSISTWTSVTGDVIFMQHLLEIYFRLEHPVLASLNKEHFLKDFFNNRYRYCSPILVNALLALGCISSTQPSARSDANDLQISGDNFFEECQRLLCRERNYPTVTTIQALGIMSIREARYGRASESWSYAGQSLRMAIELGLYKFNDQMGPDELEVQLATFWGVSGLEATLSLILSQPYP